MVGVFRPGATAVITGGASGIGLSLAKKCREHSMKVLVIDYNDEYLTALNKSVGKDMLAIKMDVASVESWAEVKATVTKDFGGMHDASDAKPTCYPCIVPHFLPIVQVRLIF